MRSSFILRLSPDAPKGESGIGPSSRLPDNLIWAMPAGAGFLGSSARAANGANEKVAIRNKRNVMVWCLGYGALESGIERTSIRGRPSGIGARCHGNFTDASKGGQAPPRPLGLGRKPIRPQCPNWPSLKKKSDAALTM